MLLECLEFRSPLNKILQHCTTIDWAFLMGPLEEPLKTALTSFQTVALTHTKKNTIISDAGNKGETNCILTMSSSQMILFE